MRRTKIVATLGPGTRAPDVLRQLIVSGADAIRLNCSHGCPDEFRADILNIRHVSAELKKPVAVILDLQGPKIRTGALEDGTPVFIEEKMRMIITTRQVKGTADMISTNYEALPDDVETGDRILISDGLIELRVVGKRGNDIECTTVHGGILKEHQGINLPGVALSTPALTDKDRSDLEFGLSQDVDFIALSFVRSASDILNLKKEIESAGRKVPVIAKIEKPEAVGNLAEIVPAADAIMVARGDLGVEMPAEEVPVIQKRMIALANAHGIPVITATQMLESMIRHPRPTRAEASDVSNAIFDGTDAVMLSGETAVGMFPVESVIMMARIAEETERCILERPWRGGGAAEGGKPEFIAGDEQSVRMHALAEAACRVAEEVGAAAIVPFTVSGRTAIAVSQLRPRTPVYALTPERSTWNRSALWRGVNCFLFPRFENTDEMIESGEAVLLKHNLARIGDTMICIAGASTNTPGGTNLLKIHHFDGENPYSQ